MYLIWPIYESSNILVSISEMRLVRRWSTIMREAVVFSYQGTKENVIEFNLIHLHKEIGFFFKKMNSRN